MTYQLKIQVCGFKNPEVWRRIIVADDRSFSQLHQIICAAFNLKTIHTHYAFIQRVKDTEIKYGPMEHYRDNYVNAKSMYLDDDLQIPGDFIMYTLEMYDWLPIRIELEKTNEGDIPHAECLDGEGAFPPYACSGPDDYDEMKQALSDINHPKHQWTLEWLSLNENETWEDMHRFDISEVNERLKKVDTDVKLFRNYTIISAKDFEKQYGITNSIQIEISKVLRRIFSNEKKSLIVRKIEKLIKEYPKIPHFRYILATHIFAGVDNERYYEMMQQLITDFPNYITAFYDIINNYERESKHAEIAKLLGEKFDLCELFPGRNGRFTMDEIFEFHSAVVKHCIYLRDFENTQYHLNYLEYLDEDLLKEHNLWNLFHRTLNYKAGDEPRAQCEVIVIPEKVALTKDKPNFTHPEVDELFKYDLSINRDILYRILDLPRESVITDLEKILIDSIARFDYYSEIDKQEMLYAPVHALSLLSVLKAEEALNSLFTVLRQSQAYYDFWFDDILTENFGSFIYNMGFNQIERLKDFALEPNRYQFVRTGISQALVFVAHFHPERKEEVSRLYVEMIQSMLDHKDEVNSDIFENEVYFSWLQDLVSISDKEQLPLILSLYDETLVERRERFTMDELKILLVSPVPAYSVRNNFSTIDQFYDEWRSWNYDDLLDDDLMDNVEDFDENEFEDDDFEDEDSDENDDWYTDKPRLYANNEHMMPIISEKVANRNDPCPCGSGKKYKKCCGAN